MHELAPVMALASAPVMAFTVGVSSQDHLKVCGHAGNHLRVRWSMSVTRPRVLWKGWMCCEIGDACVDRS